MELDHNALKYTRVSKSLTQMDVMNLIHVSQSYYTQIERGYVTPSYDVFCRLVDLFGSHIIKVPDKYEDDENMKFEIRSLYDSIRKGLLLQLNKTMENGRVTYNIVFHSPNTH